MKGRALIAMLLALALTTGCKEPKSKADKLAESEEQLVAKIEKLKERQQQITAKLAELDGRLAQVRDQRTRIRERFTEPTPTP